MIKNIYLSHFQVEVGGKLLTNIIWQAAFCHQQELSQDLCSSAFGYQDAPSYAASVIILESFEASCYHQLQCGLQDGYQICRSSSRSVTLPFPPAPGSDSPLKFYLSGQTMTQVFCVFWFKWNNPKGTIPSNKQANKPPNLILISHFSSRQVCKQTLSVTPGCTISCLVAHEDISRQSLKKSKVILRIWASGLWLEQVHTITPHSILKYGTLIESISYICQLDGRSNLSSGKRENLSLYFFLRIIQAILFLVELTAFAKFLG